MFISYFRKLVAICAIALSATQAIGQEQVDLTRDQARAVARQALFSDNPTLALQIAEAIVAQDPNDRVALLIVAAAAPRTGDPARGRAAGEQAWALSDTDAHRYEAARLTALAAARQDRFTLSTFWLRRALTVVPNDEERARTLQDARAVSRANPWSSSLSFSLAPSNNVNGGAEEEELRIEGEDTGGTIGESGVALAGWRGSLGVGVQYRFQQNQVSQSTIGLSYQGVRVRITDDTEILDESLRTDTTQLTLRVVRALENGTINFGLSRAIFDYRSFNSGTDSLDVESYDSTRLSIDRTLALSDRTQLAVGASQQQIRYSVDTLGTVDRTGLSARLSYALPSNDRIGANVQLNQSSAENTNLASNDQTFELTYSWAEPIGPITLSAGAGVTFRNYPDFVVFDPQVFNFVPLDGGRDDLRGFANLNIGFPEISYAGFIPGLRIDAARTRSNVSRYEQSLFTVGLTISSSF